ncbi:hypothetical protein niasHT_026903 [Heterodera trifolii]|uniref:Uncharacterized protein n=1 Tax=Heterodera trifolii TaxID=157864 RepID=A0ABD2JXW3_9BILA
MSPLRFLAVLLLICAMFSFNNLGLANGEESKDSQVALRPDVAAVQPDPVVVRARRGYYGGGGGCCGGGWGKKK